MCFKVWEEITIPSYTKHARYGMRAGQMNPRFLDAKLFNELVLTPYREAKFEPHTGPFLFEFPRHGMSTDEFCTRLDKFFLQLPRDFRYAVEIRNPGLLGMPYSSGAFFPWGGTRLQSLVLHALSGRTTPIDAGVHCGLYRVAPLNAVEDGL